MTVSLDDWNQAYCWFGAKYHPAEGSRSRRVVVQICSKDLVKKPPLTGKVNAFETQQRPSPQTPEGYFSSPDARRNPRAISLAGRCFPSS